MKRLALSSLAVCMMTVAMPILPAQAKTLDIAFMPPAIEPQNVCTAAPRTDLEDDLDIGQNDERLSDRMRVSFLRRDISRLQTQDPDKWFDFINALITRQAQIDESFAGPEEIMARISLYVDAGRTDALRAVGLVEQLRAMEDTLINNHRLVLAQYYLNGIGVAPDAEYARTLIRNAAYDGNENALMSIARMELEGNPVEGWDAPLDLTVTMAFGGMLGQLSPNVCRRAERIAREYLNGEVVTRNPQIAYDWYKFSADLGSAEGAWRVVEFHLEADAIQKDNKVMLQYLRLAVERGIAISEGQIEQLKASGDVDEQELLAMLGFNHSADNGRLRPSVSPLFQLAVNIDGERAEDENMYVEYLRELTQMPETPGWVYTTLAEQILISRGRWAGEPEAMAMLEEAVRREDPEGIRLLGQKLVRWRDDPVRLNRAVDLLTDAVTRFGVAPAMEDLDRLYRCQANEAPLMREANHWARGFSASQYGTVGVSATDLLRLDPFKEPEVLAQIQTQALAGRVQSLAHWVQRVQVDPWSSDRAQRLWSARIDRSDQALEAFAELEVELATNPAERDLAVELFRRVYLNNGVTTALDLAIALVEDNARSPQIAAEIIELLTKAGNRGEGAAIRLKARLLANERTEASVYQEFAREIEDRGDFLALMFAIPHVEQAVADDYFDRAVSLMNCTTKDVAELGEAHAKRGNGNMAFHWRGISLVIEGGHVLSKLRLSDSQMEVFNEGAAPGVLDVYQRALADGDISAHRRLFRLLSDPDLETYNPAEAATHLLSLLQSPRDADRTWVLTHYRKANEEVRNATAATFNIDDVFMQASQSGDANAKYEFGLMLRDTAKTPTDLINSARWLQQAAQAGNPAAMAEYGYALAYGIGVPQDMIQALQWLDRSAAAGEARAKDMAQLVRLSVGQ
ncbi:MAG: sel1 repeat family protein [Rhodobacteraceae bacterium]|nr:sel1 repeat family protein [Paracoccaceae bacterium]